MERQSTLPPLSEEEFEKIMQDNDLHISVCNDMSTEEKLFQILQKHSSPIGIVSSDNSQLTSQMVSTYIIQVVHIL